MSQKQMLQNEVLEEILRERANHYFSKKKNLDFWILIAPQFLKNNEKLNQKIKSTNFYNQRKNEITYGSSDFYSALISSDKEFIKWIQLRLGYFENIDTDIKKEIKTSYISDGIHGIIECEEGQNISPLKSNKNFLHPDILLNKYKKALDIYFLSNVEKNSIQIY